MLDSHTLQMISAAAIVVFGLYQAVLAYWIFSHGKQSETSLQAHHEETLQDAQQRHEEYMTLLQNQHTQAMQSLHEQREQSQRQHTETMAQLEDPRLSNPDVAERLADMERIVTEKLDQS